jgi:hypothetical protein
MQRLLGIGAAYPVRVVVAVRTDNMDRGRAVRQSAAGRKY